VNTLELVCVDAHGEFMWAFTKGSMVYIGESFWEALAPTHANMGLFFGKRYRIPFNRIVTHKEDIPGFGVTL
jgi:hypothetical protein